MKYHWHPVVNRLHQFIGVCSDDRIGLQRLPCGLVLPCVPQASEREEFSVLHGDGVRLLGLRIDFLPFVKPISGYEAAPTLHGFSIRRTGGDGPALALIVLNAILASFAQTGTRPPRMM